MRNWTRMIVVICNVTASEHLKDNSPTSPNSLTLNALIRVMLRGSAASASKNLIN